MKLRPDKLRDIYGNYGVRVVQVLDDKGNVYDPAYVQLRYPSMDGSPNWLAPSQVKDWRAAAQALALCVAELSAQVEHLSCIEQGEAE